MCYTMDGLWKHERNLLKLVVLLVSTVQTRKSTGRCTSDHLVLREAMRELGVPPINL